MGRFYRRQEQNYIRQCVRARVCVGVHLCEREQDKSDETERDSKK